MDQGNGRQKNFSTGSLHSKFIQLGLHQSQMAKLEKIRDVREDPRKNLVQSVFGKWQQKCIASGVVFSQNKVMFANEAGSVDCFDYVGKISNSMAREKAVGLHAHSSAQRTQLAAWVSQKPTRNAVEIWQ